MTVHSRVHRRGAFSQDVMRLLCSSVLVVSPGPVSSSSSAATLLLTARHFPQQLCDRGRTSGQQVRAAAQLRPAGGLRGPLLSVEGLHYL